MQLQEHQCRLQEMQLQQQEQQLEAQQRERERQERLDALREQQRQFEMQRKRQARTEWTESRQRAVTEQSGSQAIEQPPPEYEASSVAVSEDREVLQRPDMKRGGGGPGQVGLGSPRQWDECKGVLRRGAFVALLCRCRVLRYAALPRVDGKVFAITGTTSGTGFVAAWVVAELGGTDFESVRKAAAEIKSKYEKLYCLSLNAGIMTNHLSHFLLAAELFPLLQAEAEATGDARIVTHSSLGRLHTVNKGLEEKYFGKNGGNLGGDSIKMMGGACYHRYFQTKLANSVFTYGLHEKLKAKNSKVRSLTCHPGGSATNLSNGLKFACCMDCLMSCCIMPCMAQAPEDGAMGLIKCMMDPEAVSGTLYGPKNSGLTGPAVDNPTFDYETDPKAIEMLWRTSEEATGVKFGV
ncbi:putative oxidoreductase [Symbiodinium microadriaticum]|uniref:Putative oxidoreductase n=1 Tax=Symbiodinium microadriaticum TaxID=2951 RepID=A0A1Q9EDW7_SYMMI|nr:putative oxidoreductase [Symbiodinium microadriaticum]